MQHGALDAFADAVVVGAARWDRVMDDADLGDERTEGATGGCR
jgi:hypothetical protein